MGVMNLRAVLIKENVWVASFAILYNCLIENNVIVSTGSVISGARIPPYSMVQGNPGMIIAQYNAETRRWIPCDPIKPERWSDR